AARVAADPVDRLRAVELVGVLHRLDVGDLDGGEPDLDAGPGELVAVDVHGSAVPRVGDRGGDRVDRSLGQDRDGRRHGPGREDVGGARDRGGDLRRV
ncbi:hypothetical protein AB6A40_011856, partial [Gnathostoma spinigerum]